MVTDQEDANIPEQDVITLTRVDNVQFKAPIYVGDVAICHANIAENNTLNTQLDSAVLIKVTVRVQNYLKGKNIDIGNSLLLFYWIL